MKVNGGWHCLWRAVDYEGEVLKSYVSKRRDHKAALKFIKNNETQWPASNYSNGETALLPRSDDDHRKC